LEITLTEIRKEDSLCLFKWINDREEVYYSSPYKPVHETSHEKWFNHVTSCKGLYIFGIRLDNKLIGSCQLNEANFISRTAELQIRIGDISQRGNGYGEQTVQKLIKFGFDDLNLNRIALQVFSNNHRAIAMYEKIGFYQEGSLRQAAFINGNYTDINIMSILKHEYINR
jgi:RimJ/RimL family protein N-acetyltransferase